MPEINIHTTTGEEARWMIHDKLLMLHSPYISAQWEPDAIGVEVAHHQTLIKVGVYCIGSNHYQSFHFKTEHFEEILLFFKQLGYPCPSADPFNFQKANTETKH